jgi:multimeric flavodoxin WrbA
VKLTAFLGSPRHRGNTDLLAAGVLRGAREASLDTQTVALRKLDIHPCIGCDKCWEKGRTCVFQDDMEQLYTTIAGSDILLFATPVYWYSPTAIMKGFIDRLVPFNRPEGKAMIRGKGAILVTAYEEQGPLAAEPLIKMFDLSFNYLGLTVIDRVVVDGVGPKGAVIEKPQTLEIAYRVGVELKKWRA